MSRLIIQTASVKKQPNKTGKPNIFVGLVKCPDCGRNLAYSNPNGNEPRFRCRTYARNTELCTTHAISYKALYEIVQNDIKNHVNSMEELGDHFIKEMRELSETSGSQKIHQFNQELVSLEKRIDEIDSIFTKLIEQNALGKITDERFSKMSMNYETEQAEVVQSYRELKSKIKSEEEKVQGTDRFLETISKYKDVTELNRSMLCELIDSIYVYQAEGIGKERTQKVEINYRFLAVSH